MEISNCDIGNTYGRDRETEPVAAGTNKGKTV